MLWAARTLGGAGDESQAAGGPGATQGSVCGTLRLASRLGSVEVRPRPPSMAHGSSARPRFTATGSLLRAYLPPVAADLAVVPFRIARPSSKVFTILATDSFSPTSLVSAKH